MTKQAILFDLDGTLIDTAPDFIRIIQVMCEKYNHTAPTDTAIRSQVSAGARAMVRLMFDDELHNVNDDDPRLLAYRQEFLDLYQADICVDSRLFAGLDTLLFELEQRGVAWGIVTNKPRYLAEELLAKLALDTRCSVLVCPEDVAMTKPDPEGLLMACDTLNVNPKNALYIGDHVRDIEAGKRAGMATVIAGFGYIPPEDKDLLAWGADKIVDTPSELCQYILANL